MVRQATKQDNWKRKNVLIELLTFLNKVFIFFRQINFVLNLL